MKKNNREKEVLIFECAKEFISQHYEYLLMLEEDPDELNRICNSFIDNIEQKIKE